MNKLAKRDFLFEQKKKKEGGKSEHILVNLGFLISDVHGWMDAYMLCGKSLCGMKEYKIK